MSDQKRVGYRAPPPDKQFRPGQSGNPKGRPKGRKNFHTELAEELEQTITVIEGGQETKITKRRGIVKALIGKAIKGDVRAAMALITFFEKPEPEGAGETSSADEPLLRDFVEREIQRRLSGAGSAIDGVENEE